MKRRSLLRSFLLAPPAFVIGCHVPDDYVRPQEQKWRWRDGEKPQNGPLLTKIRTQVAEFETVFGFKPNRVFMTKQQADELGYSIFRSEPYPIKEMRVHDCTVVLVDDFRGIAHTQPIVFHEGHYTDEWFKKRFGTTLTGYAYVHDGHRSSYFGVNAQEFYEGEIQWAPLQRIRKIDGEPRTFEYPFNE